MPVHTNQVQEGKCFRTAANQQRHVWAVRGGKVFYLARGGNAGGPWNYGHSLSSPPSLWKFAEDVEAEIECPQAEVPKLADLPAFDVPPATAKVDDAVASALANERDMLLLEQELWEAFKAENTLQGELVGSDEEINYRGVRLRCSAVS